MLKIKQAVGVNGSNQYQDVLAIQKALNKIKPLLNAKRLAEDGLYGKNTASAIFEFQLKYVKMVKPDERIDPDGNSIKVLKTIVEKNERLLFPLECKPAQSYRTGMCSFGSDRSSGSRKHAGCDLYAPTGTPIRAISDGIVIQDYPFYLGTRALEIDHGDVLVRYGEISHVAVGIKKGAAVNRGQIIAYVGELIFPSGTKMSMLHIEFYKGILMGPLTIRDSMPYQRRMDLIDPTTYLDSAAMH